MRKISKSRRKIRADDNLAEARQQQNEHSRHDQQDIPRGETAKEESGHDCHEQADRKDHGVMHQRPEQENLLRIGKLLDITFGGDEGIANAGDNEANNCEPDERREGGLQSQLLEGEAN